MTATRPPNPFAYGRDYSPLALVGRRAELAEVGRAIRNRGRLFLVGPRRFGKTALLSAAEAAAGGTVVLRFDVEAYETAEALAAAILTGAVRARRGPSDRVASALSRSAARLRPLLEVDPASGQPSVVVGATTSDVEAPMILTGALDAVGQIAAEWGRNVVVVLDEVQQALSGPGLKAERQLAATMAGQPHVGYILASSAPRLSTAIATSMGHPFQGMGALLALGPVPETEYLAFLERSFRDTGILVDDGACGQIVARSRSVPYNVQRLAGAVWEFVRAAAGTPTVTVAAVDRTLDRLVRGDDPLYMQLWASLTTNQKKTVRAAIESDGANLQSGNVSRRFAIPAASVQVALAGLEDRHVLRRGLDDSTRYRLVDPFLADWLASAQA